jgi:2-iminobutanoate/2-iminopropanoate deaminase
MKPLPIFLCGVLAVYCAARSLAGESPRLSEDASYHMKRQIISTPDAPKSPLYSQAVKVGPTIYVTGVPGLDPQTNKVAGPTIQEQTRRALLNCENILRAAGAKLEDVVEVQVLLARPGDFAGLNEEYARFFPGNPPVRSVARLGPELGDILVSIRVTAVISDE